MTDLAARRRFLQSTSLGVSAAYWPRIGAANPPAANAARQVIVIFLQGGLSHLDSWDLKPEAPKEYRGEFRPIATTVPGFEICEHMPLLAQRAERYSVIRSAYHGTPSHEAAIHWTLTGFDYPGANTTNKNRNIRPAMGSIVAKLRGANHAGLPAYVCVPDRGQLGDRVRYASATYLGPAYDPLESGATPANATAPFPPPKNLSLADGIAVQRLDDRLSLLRNLDDLPRILDASGSIAGVDEFNRQALELLASDRTRQAFDLSNESTETRTRYGDSTFGQRVILARRLAEAGVTFTLVNFSNNQEWDTHQNNFGQLKTRRLPELDQAVSALLDDLTERGLLETTLVALFGEFGRTPLINAAAGRDHWSNVFSVMLAGGGLRGGQVLGTSTSKAEDPLDRPVHFNEVLKTMYQQLGVATDRSFLDLQGRPVAVLDHGQAIPELL